jgi:putative DNA primase/helicase
LETSDGDRELWGIDLRRALEQSASRPQIGDAIGIRAVRRDAVKVWAPERDAEGQVIGEKRREAHRNTWIIESQEFLGRRAQAAQSVRDPRIDQRRVVKHHPELIGTYLQLHATELAARAIRNPEDRERFVSLVRHALADSIERGEPLSPVRIKEADARNPGATAAPRPPEREAAPTR